LEFVLLVQIKRVTRTTHSSHIQQAGEQPIAEYDIKENPQYSHLDY